MGIGVSIALIAVGLIMAFAMGESIVLGMDMNVVGIILAGCGALGLVITLIIFAPRRRSMSGGYSQPPTKNSQHTQQYPPRSY